MCREFVMCMENKRSRYENRRLWRWRHQGLLWFTNNSVFASASLGDNYNNNEANNNKNNININIHNNKKNNDEENNK